MNKEIENKIDSLLKNMSLKEKIGQLNQVKSPESISDVKMCKEKIKNGMVGSIIFADTAQAGNAEWNQLNTELYEELQRIAVEESRCGIPLIFGRDVIHGHKTVFPIPLAMACSFDEKLISESYRAIAEEAAGDGIHWAFTPMLDMCHDPRWGRVIEGPGEDPYIGVLLANGVVKGLQGDDLSANDSVVACAKHFIGYGASESGIDYHRAEISDYSLYNMYLSAFRAAVDAGVRTVMSSFNDINGQPLSCGKRYINGILKKDIGFDGFVVSDWCSIDQLILQGVADNIEECAELALNTGIDMDMTNDVYIECLENLVRNGKVSEKSIDEAVRRILRVKFEKNLFEKPYRAKIAYDRNKHIELARTAAAESMVLLKNDDVLPLSKNIKIAVMGSMVNQRRALLGSWTLDGKAEETPTLLEELILKIGSENISVAEDDNGRYDEALKNAVNADVILLAVGESEKLSGEAHCISDISLNDSDLELLKKARAIGKKIICLMFCGRNVSMNGVTENADAVLYAWHSGSSAAGAAADLLFGDRIPCGKTVMTFLKKPTHIPMYYNITPSGRPVNCYYGQNVAACYLDSEAKPEYPFGYGLSYTKFDYSKPQASSYEFELDKIKNGDSISFKVEISNIGIYDAKEIAELYIRDKKSTYMRPIKELKKVKKVFVEKQKSVTVEFRLGYGDFGYYFPNGEYVVEPGKFDIYVGSDCFTENKTEILII